GEEDAGFLCLEEAGVRAAGPLHYNLEAGLSGGGLFATGSLRLRVAMTCVVTLEVFEREIEVTDFAAQKELDGREWVDLSEEIRDEIHLALPAHPRSAQAAERDGLRPGGSALAPPASGAWKALDQLHPPKT
ncbi:MAG: DUF177 domain-containing protein, partial [Terrimicrobiaceae bacterium]|nr:DUF177 domain-containing protein [Terrimicrobiaceae bacterium]